LIFLVIIKILNKIKRLKLEVSKWKLIKFEIQIKKKSKSFSISSELGDNWNK